MYYQYDRHIFDILPKNDCALYSVADGVPCGVPRGLDLAWLAFRHARSTS